MSYGFRKGRRRVTPMAPLSQAEVEAEIAAKEEEIARDREFRAAHSRGKPVHAYEDNAGGVHVFAEEDEEAYEAPYTQRGERFRDMAEMIDTNDITNFSTNTSPAQDIGGRHLATYHKGSVTHHVTPEEVTSLSLKRWLGFE